MPAVVGRGLRKRFGDRPVLEGVDISIDDGERVGLVGNNGSGKSTLARILAGAVEPDDGSVVVRRGARIGYLSQAPALTPGLSARQAAREGLAAWEEARRRHEQLSEALATGDGDADALLAAQADAAHDLERLGGWTVGHEVDAVLGHVGIPDPEIAVDAMSGGERRRVALARLLVSRPDLAVLDEPTNHLDIETIEWLERHLAERFGGAILLVTHDRYLLDRVVDRTLELDEGVLYSYDGGYGDYVEAKAKRMQIVARTEANRQNLLRRELDWLRRQPKARTTKSRSRVQRAEALVAQDAPRTERVADLSASATRSGKTVVELADVRIERGGKTLVNDLTLSMTPGTRLGIVGRNGTGKTSLLQAMMGTLEPTRGRIATGKHTRFAYLDQERAALPDDVTVLEAVSEGRAHVEMGESTLDMRAYLERLLVTGSQLRQKVGSLSGGERARVALAKILSHPANVVVLDEPTNDLDVATLGALEALMTEYGGTCLVVTHDRWFLDRVATAILAFEGDGEVVRYEGGWTTYLSLRAQARSLAPSEAEDPTPSPAAAAAEPAKPQASAKKLTYAERIELEGLEAKVEAADARVAQLEAQLADPDTYAGDPARARELVDALSAARTEAETITERWAELEDRRG